MVFSKYLLNKWTDYLSPSPEKGGWGLESEASNLTGPCFCPLREGNYSFPSPSSHLCSVGLSASRNHLGSNKGREDGEANNEDIPPRVNVSQVEAGESTRQNHCWSLPASHLCRTEVIKEVGRGLAQQSTYYRAGQVVMGRDHQKAQGPRSRIRKPRCG